MRQRFVRVVLILISIRLAVGCASIMHGTTQDIHLATSPDQAEVWIDGSRWGTTPTRVTLMRKSDYLVTFKKKGYRDATFRIEGTTSAWIVGCGIDFLNGGAYDLKPEWLDVNLTKLAELDGKTIHLERAQLDKIKQLRLVDEHGNPQYVLNIAWTD